MRSDEVNAVMKTAADSLDKTQKNAIDMEGPVQQVLSLSDYAMHERTVSAVLDSKASINNKVEMVRKLNAEYDKRIKHNTRRVKSIQNTQTKNTGVTTNRWAKNCGWIAVACVTCTLVITPDGRKLTGKLISSGVKFFTSAA